MKILLILSLATLACNAKLYTNRPLNNLDLLRSRTSLTDDFKDIGAVIPKRQLTDLIRMYLTKDTEFQRIIFYFGSQEAYKAGELIGSQPEIKDLYLWLKVQLNASDESNSEEYYSNILNYKPNKQQLLGSGGWKGFMKELLAIYPRKEISNLIRDKVAANGVFAEFWSKVIALRPV